MELILWIAAGLVALLLALYLIACLFSGAVFLLAWASEQGFVGIAAYVACWVFLSPVMIGASILIGMVLTWPLRGEKS